MGDYGTNAIQAGDVLMFHQEDRGEIIEDGGFIQMTDGYETMAYLSLFGGNEKDDGSEATARLQWWGNEDEEPENQYRSRFQALVASGRPVTSEFVTELAAAAEKDLGDDFVAGGFASAVKILSIRLVNPKRIALSVKIEMLEGTALPFMIEGDL